MSVIDPIKTRELIKHYQGKMSETLLQLLDRRNDGKRLSVKEEKFLDDHSRLLLDFFFLTEEEPTDED